VSFATALIEGVYVFSIFQQAKDAKACLRLDFINVTIVPEKIGNPNGIQIYFEHGDKIRNIYAYAETGQVCCTQCSIC
jgi:Arf-GAP with dual PH domain-containing protein